LAFLWLQISISPNEVAAVDDDETESLDEACPSAGPVRLVRRPRLAILLQACKAVVGAGQHWSDYSKSPLDDQGEEDAGRQQVQTQAAAPATAEAGRHHVEHHYESPLVAKLRQVEVRVIKSVSCFVCIARRCCRVLVSTLFA
jgi:hypothetical protein